MVEVNAEGENDDEVEANDSGSISPQQNLEPAEKRRKNENIILGI